MSYNYKGQSQARYKLWRLPELLSEQEILVACIIVAHVRPRTSRGITDLLLPQTSMCFAHSPSKKDTRLKIRLLFSRLRSRSLTELTRQITPPTKNGHAPPPIESRKSSHFCQSHPCLALVSFPVLSQIKPQAPLLVCPSVNSFKFQTCVHTSPGTQRLMISHNVLRELKSS